MSKLKPIFETAVQEYQELEKQFAQLQQNLIQRQGSIQTLQQLIELEEAESESEDEADEQES